MLQNDIVNKYIEDDLMNDIDSIEDANKISKMCHSII